MIPAGNYLRNLILTYPQLWITLCVFAALFGLYFSKAYAPYLDHEPAPVWGAARWITPGQNSAVAYYRYRFEYDGSTGGAWLQLAAPDSFSVSINGQPVGSSVYASVINYDVFDVRRYLVLGTNVVAVKVTRKTYPGAASLIARLAWVDLSGANRTIETGEHWRVLRHGESQQFGEVSWNKQAFEDTHWPHAVLTAPESPIKPNHPWATPALFELLPRGEWIWARDSQISAATFRRDFELPARRIESAWLGVATTGNYTVTINGMTPVSANPSAEFMDTYDIGPYLRHGANHLQIDVSRNALNARLATGGLIITGSGMVDISSDSRWQVRADNITPGDQPWVAATILGGMKTDTLLSQSEKAAGIPQGAPTLRLSPALTEGGLTWRRVLRSLPLISITFAIGMAALALILTRDRPRIYDAEAYQAPLLVAILILATAFLLPFDVRISEAAVFRPLIAFVILGMVIAWEWRIMNEGRPGNARQRAHSV
jgi:hypothetical protein